MRDKIPEQPWWVYIVECKDGSYYTGISTDIEKRVAKHNLGTGAKYTKVRLPVKLLYTEKQANLSQAAKRESEIKKLSRNKKKELISGILKYDTIKCSSEYITTRK